MQFRQNLLEAYDSFPFAVLHWYALVGAPFAALGSLNGRMKSGILIGLVVALISGVYQLPSIE